MFPNVDFLKYIRNCFRFDILLMITISYSVGAGLVSYLGKGINQPHFWIGLLISNLFYIASELIESYFFYTAKYAQKRDVELLKVRNSIFILFILSLTVVSLFTYILYQDFMPVSLFLVFWTAFLVFMILYSIPPMKMKERGFGEILISILVVSITPMFALILQMEEIHSTLFLITFPVFFLLMSYFLVQMVEKYAQDIKHNHNSLMTKLGWKTGMNLHNLFILATYLLYGSGAILGLPSRLTLPALFSFPIACIQLWEMWRISEGYKPRWKLLKVSSAGSLSILAYFYLFYLWLR